jgi:diguanylate cyclase (GGDEF)-like protein
VERLGNPLSTFSHAADRGAAVAYFLGAVVPLVVLGIVTERYVLAPIAEPIDAFWVVGSGWVLALFGSISFLSLSCFFMLRLLVRRSLDENRALAYYDGLTGLPNRRMYEDRLEQALMHAQRQGTLVATCFLDLDGFKRINDTLGHGSGDQLLCRVSERLVGSMRRGDSFVRARSDETQSAVSRLGGDEFTFLLTGISDAQDAGRAARRILYSLREPFQIDHHEVFVTASIGIAVFPFDGEEAETLRRNADTAMYWAKDRGRNNYQFYSSFMNETAERKLELEGRLRRALKSDGFTLFYQPVRDAVSGDVVGAEALLRWVDPEIGPVPPSEFVPIAEDTGLIAEIGGWVLRTACAQAQAWQDEGFRAIRMGVNVSGHQLRQPTFLESVARALRETGISPGCLEMEITESTIMQDDSVTVATCRQLDEMGVGLVLDDFGTGYSSLSYLRRFPIGRVKIDRSFVSELPACRDDAALTKGIIAMAHSLGLEVVAEGVETVEQAEFLRQVHCDDLQGYLFSPAVPLAEFARFLSLDKRE